MNEQEMIQALAALADIGANKLNDMVRVPMPYAQFELSKEGEQFKVAFRTERDYEFELYQTLEESIYELRDEFYSIIEAAFSEEKD